MTKGDSRRALYLHGLASGPSSAKAQFFGARVQELGWRLEIPDWSEGDFEHLSITRGLRVIDRILAGEPMPLIGSSLGGYLAALYASINPWIPRLVLLAPAFHFAWRWPESLGPQRLQEWRNSGYLEVWHYASQRPARLHWSFLEDARRFPPAPSVSQPTLIIHGRQDTVVPVELSLDYQAAHPHVRLEQVDSDHQLTDALETVWPRVRDFLLSGAGTKE